MSVREYFTNLLGSINRGSSIEYHGYFIVIFKSTPDHITIYVEYDNISYNWVLPLDNDIIDSFFENQTQITRTDHISLLRDIYYRYIRINMFLS